MEEQDQRKNQRKRRNTVEREPKLRTYRQLKTKLQFERIYLTTRDREAREVMTRLRGGTNELRMERSKMRHIL